MKKSKRASSVLLLKPTFIEWCRLNHACQQGMTDIGLTGKKTFNSILRDWRFSKMPRIASYLHWIFYRMERDGQLPWRE